jgi:acetate kinase
VRGAADAQLVADAVAAWGGEPIAAVGHRVVHGGTVFSSAAVLTDAVIARIAGLTALAPLHQPKSLAAIEAVRAVLSDLPHVACFDTAFHATLPAAASTYAVPAEWRERWGLRRYGFHGLSHAYASRRVAELCGRLGDPSFRVVTCHLGAGASLAAVLGGVSRDTTMGFTPLEGLVMATRSGNVDPGLVLWLARDQGVPVAEISDALEHRSGLLGLGGSEDMRAILAGAAAGEESAHLALGVYLHRLRGAIAAMAASIGGLDALVFTGGVGERSAPVRAMAGDGLAFLGVAIAPARHDAPGDHGRAVSPDGAVARTWVVPAREDVEIAREVREAVAAG